MITELSKMSASLTLGYLFFEPPLAGLTLSVGLFAYQMQNISQGEDLQAYKKVANVSLSIFSLIMCHTLSESIATHSELRDLSNEIFSKITAVAMLSLLCLVSGLAAAISKKMYRLRIEA